MSLSVAAEGRYPSGPNGEHLPSYTVAVGCDITGSDEQRLAALADLRHFMMPAEPREIERWILELSLITAGRGRDGTDAELMLQAYASRLREYPADVARHALLKGAWKWWPSWAELERVCETLAGPRRHMIAALQRPAPDPEPRRRPATQEERDRVQAMVDAMFPSRPKAERLAAVNEALRGNCMKDEP